LETQLPDRKNVARMPRSRRIWMIVGAAEPDSAPASKVSATMPLAGSPLTTSVQSQTSSACAAANSSPRLNSSGPSIEPT
jgi:hypothetical protein